MSHHNTAQHKTTRTIRTTVYAKSTATCQHGMGEWIGECDVIGEPRQGNDGDAEIDQKLGMAR